ncbi:MAG: DegV family protein [Eubacteriales bacterium]|nr:DegV family protein [Eubacteriales bacterium]
MSYKIVIDSCGELTEEMKKSGHFETASLTISVDGYDIVDDETFDQADFLKRVAASPDGPKSACPSPGTYQSMFECDADHIYAVTLSAELSGSYNSAVLGRDLCLENDPEKKIYVFNSRSASIGETLIGLKIQECEEAGMEFEEVIRTVEEYISEQVTWFVLESLETLRKNGRLSFMKAVIANALKIKPVMSSTPTGAIEQLAQARGINRALVKMVDYIVEKSADEKGKTVAISHCNCPERAQMVKDALAERLPDHNFLVVDTAGISSMYANDGGVIAVV